MLGTVLAIVKRSACSETPSVAASSVERTKPLIRDTIVPAAMIALAVHPAGQGYSLTDMFGSTPSNLAVGACRKSGRAVLYGANLPLLVKLAKARRMSLGDACASALNVGRKYINSVEAFGSDRTPIAL